jgi:2'-5' RNA ligase
MQYFIGIVPPSDFTEKIIKFQQLWKKNDLIKVVEPHITVKAQGGLTPTMEWVNNVKKMCESILAFDVTLNKPKFFGEDVLFLTVKSEAINKLHQMLVETVSPSQELIKRYLELENYEPHLTLGQTHFGLSRKELKEMAEKAVEYLSPYPTFEVDFIRIYQEIEPNKFIKYIDIPLIKQRI